MLVFLVSTKALRWFLCLFLLRQLLTSLQARVPYARTALDDANRQFACFSFPITKCCADQELRKRLAAAENMVHMLLSKERE